jgi:hypothetical protein
MRPIARLVVIAALALQPALTLGEGKCGDDPVKFGPKDQLVVTWGLPIPKDSVVKVVDGQVFAAVEAKAGSEVPANFPSKYLQDLKRVDLFNSSTVYDTPALTAWEKKYEITMGAKALKIFGDHMAPGNAVQVSLVEHPSVAQPKGYSRCTCTLQRGVAVFTDGREDLYVRSYFHSAKDDKNVANFVPTGGLLVSFRSDKIWFPLRLNELIQEPMAYLVLDVLTVRPLALAAVPAPLMAASKGQVVLDGITYHVTRVTGTYSQNQSVSDLTIAAP